MHTTLQLCRRVPAVLTPVELFLSRLFSAGAVAMPIVFVAPFIIAAAAVGLVVAAPAAAIAAAETDHKDSVCASVMQIYAYSYTYVYTYKYIYIYI